MIDYTEYSNDGYMNEMFVEEPVVEEVETVETEEEIVEDETPIGLVTANHLYLRESPSKKSKEVTVLDKDDEVMALEPIDYNDEWCHVCTSSGAEGYVMLKFVSF